MTTADTKPTNFIHEIIEEDLRTDRNGAGGKVITRFPPEPNAYLHVGHAKSICLNFGTAAKYAGRCNLRMDDTNPMKEEQEYIDAIKADIRWLGFDWGQYEFHASDNFEQLYEWAVLLIKAGKAYVCDLSAEEISRSRGTLTSPGRNSPFRDRPAQENLNLFERMRAGEFPDGSRTLRAKIDMAAPNVNLRDPVMYRILHAPHPHTGDKWCVYPTYDWAHGQSDWIEGITHSICTLEFEDHRPLYDWYIEQIRAAGGGAKGISYRPRQYEFSRLNITHTVLSKRRLRELVEAGIVSGYDDPRLPSLAALRRRGVTAQALRALADRVGVTKMNSTTDLALLEHCVREDLNKRAPRVMAVLHPLRIVIDNWPEGKVEQVEAVNNPEDPAAGKRQLPFSRVLYIEHDDFMENPPKKFFRLAPGCEVRLRYAYVVKCVGVSKDAAGNVSELHCTYDPQTLHQNPDRKIKGIIHWVSAEHAVPAEVRLYDTLFASANPMDVADGTDWRTGLNPKSLEVLSGCKLEPSLAAAAGAAGQWSDGIARFQFERLGYFCVDRDSTAQRPVFNRTVTLRDTWAKIESKG